jgi:hydroxymethylbilane synthase
MFLLYEMGITGIFTKTLDVAMLTGKIDIAVHSMKDVPTTLPKGIVEAAVLKRANTSDILLHKGLIFLIQKEGLLQPGVCAGRLSGLNRYPSHTVVDLRGNVNTRMKKLEENTWDGAIFAAAGLERINLKPDDHLELGWMLPAPAQGAMLVVAMQEDDHCREALAALHHHDSGICVHIEREFLKTLEGGCTAPIGALATIENDIIHFSGVLFSLDGNRKIEVTKEIPVKDSDSFGKHCALEVLQNGGKELMGEIRKVLN